MSSDILQVLIIGDTDTPEMRGVLQFVEEQLAGHRLEQAADIPAAERIIQEQHWFPDLVVVCQNWPDEFPESEVLRLLALLPLARWVCCFGAWCESDGRNRSIWPVSIRTTARGCAGRIRREREVLLGNRTALPLTASRDEAFAFDADVGLNMGATEISVAVRSPDYRFGHWIEELLAGSGFHASRPTVGFGIDVVLSSDVSAVVWDVDPWNDERTAELSDFRSRHPQVAVVALMGLAHPEDVARAIGCGVDAVVTKLTASEDLPRSLMDAVASRPQLSQ